MSANATLDQIRSYRTSVTQALLDQHARKGLCPVSVTPFTDATPVTEPLATGAQKSYLLDLMARLAAHAPAVHTEAMAWIIKLGGMNALTKVDASRAIDAVKRHLATPAPAMDKLAALLADVQGDRRYAVEVGDAGSNDWRFYRVTRAKTIEVGHANGHGIRWERLGLPAQLAVARQIARDPREAMLNFGRHLGVCGRCGRVLTNQASREAGIGDWCSTK